MFHNLMKHSILANHSPRKNHEESQITLAIVMTSHPLPLYAMAKLQRQSTPKLLCAILRAMNVAEDIAALLQQCAQFQRVCSIATFRAMA